MRRILAVASLAVLVGCGPNSATLRCTSATDPSPVLGESFTVRYHETATVEGEALSLAFAELVNDSRCPSGVQCVWEGNAEVKVTATKKSEEPQTFALNTNGRFETEASYQGYTVRLVNLIPYPEAEKSIASQSYCVELRATRP